ncbi:hypothetical protein KP509_37G031400 [Ceratopteris richardii]|uniref:Glycine rich protein n=1 Tax=Ceratopteris richardii TaxID=49495 RepID=A0A8T2Q6K6_CERRI|nr:hypothetical protein KP509_37G031300 [Ceratopteris richardii]KAH7279688.1 hypothetical protein KP509_37G031400 [Ceratopteris richardii]
MASMKVVPVCLLILAILALAYCKTSEAATSYEKNVEAAGDAMNLDHGFYHGRHDGYYGRRRGRGYYGGRGRYRGGHGQSKVSYRGFSTRLKAKFRFSVGVFSICRHRQHVNKG